MLWLTPAEVETLTGRRRWKDLGTTTGMHAMNEARKAARELAVQQATERAWRIADRAAEELIESEGVKTSGIDEYSFAANDLAADEHMDSCIAHCVWRGLAVRHDCGDVVIVQLGDFTIGA